jgi:hypothetical protein
LFYFPHYGKYEEYDEAQNAITLSDLQVVNWMLSQFATIDEVREAIEGVKVSWFGREHRIIACCVMMMVMGVLVLTSIAYWFRGINWSFVLPWQ